MYSCCAGDAPVCDPKTYFECALLSMEDYVSNNKAAMCICPRQCRHLSYNHDTSQALISNHLVKYIKRQVLPLELLNLTIDVIRNEICMLEVVRYGIVPNYGHIYCNTQQLECLECAVVRGVDCCKLWGDQGI